MPTSSQEVFRDDVADPSSNDFFFDFSDSQLADPSSSDFFFDFSSFGLNPDSTWAYHTSVPGSPAERTIA